MIKKRMKKNSKGLSTIVATLLIILLVLVAVGIVWVVVRGVLEKNSEQISLGKFTLNLEIAQVQKINDSSLNVTVKRNPGQGEFVGINFIFDDGENTEVVRTNASLQELGIKKFELHLILLNASKLKKISIVPIFKLKSGEEINGEVSDEYKIASIDSESGIVDEEEDDEEEEEEETPAANCSDGIQNQDETGIDCGGICVGCVEEADYYVAKWGNDSWSGNFTHPWLTLTYAESKMKGGEFLYIREGIYNERLRVYGLTQGTEQTPTIFSAYPGEKVIIDGNGIEQDAGTALVRTSNDYTYFINLEVKNSNRGGIMFDTTSDYSVMINCTAHNISGTGIASYGNYNLVENCTVYDAAMSNSDGVWQKEEGETWGAGMNIRGNYSVARNNIVHDAWGEGLSITQANYGIIEENTVYDSFSVVLYIMNSHNSLVQGNLVYMSKKMGEGTAVGIGHWNEAYVGGHENENNTIINNIVYGCYRNFYNGCSLKRTVIANNIFVNSLRNWSVQITGGDHINGTFANNIIVQEDSLPPIYVPTPIDPQLLMSHNLYNKAYDNDAVGVGDIIGDPLFSKTGSGADYFRLLEGSPAIDAGILLAEVSEDYFGIMRGSSPDIGAFESPYTANPILPACTDSDNDEYSSEGGECGARDCNDNNANINPGATDICGNNIDEDCDEYDKSCLSLIAKYTDAETGYEIWRMTNSSVRDIMQYYHHATMSPDGKYLIFRSNRVPYLYIINSDGTNEKAIGNYTIWNSQRGIDFSSGNLQGWFSNDGKKYYTYKKLYVIDIEKFQKGYSPDDYISQVSSTYAENFFFPMLSPDGRKLFGLNISSDNLAGGTLKIINIDGTGFKEFTPPLYVTEYGTPGLDVTHGWLGNEQGWYVNNDPQGIYNGLGGTVVFNVSDGAKASDYPVLRVFDPSGEDIWYGHLAHITLSPSAYFIGKGEGLVAGHGRDYKAFNTKYWSQDAAVREEIVVADYQVAGHYLFSPDAKWLSVADYLNGSANKGFVVVYNISLYNTPTRIARYTTAERAGTLSVSSDPTFSPDGTKLIYMGDIKEIGNEDIYIAVFKKPNIPTDFTATNIGGKLKLTWKPANMHKEIKEYEIYKSNTQSGTYSKIATVPEVITFVEASSKISSSATTIYVDSTEGFASSGIIEIAGLSNEVSSELVSYSGKTTNSFTGCIRGVLGTTAAEHYNDAFVWKYTGDIGHVLDYAPGYYKIKSVEWSDLSSEFSNSIFVA